MAIYLTAALERYRIAAVSLSYELRMTGIPLRV